MRRLIGVLPALCLGLMSPLGGCSSGTAPAGDRASARRIADEGRDDKAAKKQEAGAPFELPADNVGRLLGQVLPPASKEGPLERPDRPAPPKVPLPSAAEPAVVLPAGSALVARLPSPVRKQPLRPRLVLDESFEGSLNEPLLPHSPSFEAGKPVAVESEDVSIPPPLPILAVPVPDRVPAEDFTAEASTEMVLTAPLPRRTTAVPFTRASVPEPFEYRRPLTTKPPQEPTTPAADGPAVPK